MNIYYSPEQDLWMVKDSDPMVLDLFGTDTLPTPFSSPMPGGAVLARVQALNPGRTVTLTPFYF